MKEIKDLEDLLKHEVQTLYSAEVLLLAGIPRMAAKAQDAQLKAALELHLKETQTHKERLEKVAKMLNIDPAGDGNPAMKGLIAEGEKVMHIDATPEAMDAAIICGAQRIEHYEISGYGTAAHLAEGLALTEVFQLLNQTLQEEQATDTKLNNLAKSTINHKAA